jgi:2-polyprenyl-6-methoxyphenol hydroxylase-like FAD-dependent oxidoreductase
MDNKDILISGAGIAGTTLAFWLKKFGFNPTIIENASRLRDGGYAIDFWGKGFDVAEKMGIIPELEKADLKISELTFVDGNDKRKSGLNYRRIKTMMNNRAFTLLRSDLAKAIFNQFDSGIETIFGDSISDIQQQKSHVLATFRSGTARKFDLVIGADGLHSTVRNLVFGSEEEFEKFYGYYTSSYSFGVRNFNEVFRLYMAPNKQAAIYSTGQNKTTAFFIFSSKEKLSYPSQGIEMQKDILRMEFQKAGWKCAQLLSQLDAASDFYFDVVSQVQMKKWSRGRVTLVGDACSCPSLLSGQGSTLAMVGAYILATELKQANGNHAAAFEQYEATFKPFVDKKQVAAQNFAKAFVAKTNFGIWMRNTFIKLMFLPFLSKIFIKQFMDDDFKLKDPIYG